MTPPRPSVAVTPTEAATPGPATSGDVRRPDRWSWAPPVVRTTAPVWVAVMVAFVLHLLWWRFLPTSGGDLAAQDAWAEFARQHPGSAYNLGWYGGMHPISYSLLSPYVMAVIGVRASMIVAGSISAGLLAWLVVGRRPGADRWQPALYGAFALAGNAVSGRVTFALGAMFGLAAMCVVFAWPWRTEGRGVRWTRGVLTGLGSALATAASPVAGLFLGLVAAATWLQGRRAASLALGVPPTLMVAVSAYFFPFDGRQPMAWNSAILPVCTAVAVIGLVPRHWRLVRLGAGVYLVSVLLAWIVPSPVGTNIERMGLLFGGVVLVAAALADWRSSAAARSLGLRTTRALLVMTILGSTIWQVALAGRDAATSSPPESWTDDITPLIAQLEARNADRGRVEVVPTKTHLEATEIAPHVPLARGWNRQADAERNPIFYRDRPLTPAAYRRWLHRWAVGYVVLSNATPDHAAEEEAALVAGGLPYLRAVWSDGDWTLYAVRNPTPLVSPPAEVLAYDASELTITTPGPGRFVIRIADSPWLSLVDLTGRPLAADTGACLTNLEAEASADETDDAPQRTRRDDWLVLRAPSAGTYRIAAPYKLPRGTACPTP